MRSIAFADFLIGLGILFVLEGLMFAASPAWMRRAMKSALATPDNILRAVGIGSAIAGLILIWAVRRLNCGASSFRGDAKRRTRNLEIPAALDASHRPGMTSAQQRRVRQGVPLFAVFSDPYRRGMSASNACAATLFGRTVDIKFRPVLRGEKLI